MTTKLFIILAVFIIMAAAIIYLEISFAKMNEGKEDGIESTISVLEDIGATNIKHAENG